MKFLVAPSSKGKTSMSCGIQSGRSSAACGIQTGRM